MFLLNFPRIVSWRWQFRTAQGFYIFHYMYVGLNTRLLGLKPREVIIHLWGSRVENFLISLLILSMFLLLCHVNQMTYLNSITYAYC